jgi:spermidine synthase
MNERGHISWVHKAFSFLFPIVLKEINSPVYLQFVLKNNIILLNTQQANQSNGTLKYALHQAFSHFNWYQKKEIQHILILGFGLGSAYDLLAPTYPKAIFTGVEIQPEIKDFYTQYYPKNLSLNWQIQSAADFINITNSTYDLILIDVFEDTTIPDAILTLNFFKTCLQKLNQKGTILFNTLSQNKIEDTYPELHTFFDTYRDTITSNRFYLKEKIK